MSEDGPVAPAGRGRWVAVGGLAIVVLAVVVTVAVTRGGADRAVPAGELPTLANQFAEPAAAPPAPERDEPAAVPAHTGAPLWSVPAPMAEERVDLAVSDHGYVIARGGEVVALDRSGTRVWRWAPGADQVTVRVTGPLVLAGYDHPDDDRWPKPVIVVALDAATGREVWREEEASFWSATTEAVYLSVCRGGQNDRLGDCRFSARDPRTNAVRWTIPTYASSRVVGGPSGAQAPAPPPYLLLASYPTGLDSLILSTHDPATGATLGRGFRDDDGSVGTASAATARTVVTYQDHDDNPADGCTATLSGFAVNGATRTWRQVATTAKLDDGRRCAPLPFTVNDGRVGLTAENGGAGVLDVDTGKVEWSTPAAGQAVAASAALLLVVDEGELVAYRPGTADPAWRAPFPGDVRGSTVTIADTSVVVTGYGRTQLGYDVRSGRARSYGPGLVLETPASFAVCDGGTCRGFPIG